MQTKRLVVRLTVWGAFSLAILAGLTSVLAFAQTGAVAVVVNETNPVTNLTTAELRKLFAGETRSWRGGVPVVLFVRAPGAYEPFVLMRLLGMSENDYKRHWTEQVFRGEARTEPVALFSNGMQKEAVAVFPGGVALVSLQDVKPGMKVVKVNGHLPTEPGYPLPQ
jgi:ABC-type phosphate transport system substrate-binding protein